jgi:hypothetical protein
MPAATIPGSKEVGPTPGDHPLAAHAGKPEGDDKRLGKSVRMAGFKLNLRLLRTGILSF